MVLFNQRMQVAQLPAAEPTRLGQGDGRTQPELGEALGLLDMDMKRLLALTAEEEKAVTSTRKISGMRRTR